jgi:hypothetical protein
MCVLRVLRKIQRLLNQLEDIRHSVVTSATFGVGPVSGEGPCTQGDDNTEKTFQSNDILLTTIQGAAQYDQSPSKSFGMEAVWHCFHQ